MGKLVIGFEHVYYCNLVFNLGLGCLWRKAESRALTMTGFDTVLLHSPKVSHWETHVLEGYIETLD